MTSTGRQWFHVLRDHDLFDLTDDIDLVLSNDGDYTPDDDVMTHVTTVLLAAAAGWIKAPTCISATPNGSLCLFWGPHDMLFITPAPQQGMSWWHLPSNTYRKVGPLDLVSLVGTPNT